VVKEREVCRKEGSLEGGGGSASCEGGAKKGASIAGKKTEAAVGGERLRGKKESK